MEFDEEGDVVMTSVTEIWDNLPSINKAVSVALIVLYAITFVGSIFLVREAPWYITVGLVVWPMIAVAWIAGIWAMFAIISAVAIVFQGKISASTARALWAQRIAKSVLFVPTVIGSALAVVDVFAAEIFQKEE